MVSVLIFLAILSVLIIVHELGHFLVAKKLGVTVERFSIGFGKVLLKRKHEGTEYCLSAVPLGGYVKMAGDSLEDYHGKKGEYFALPPGKRFFIIFFGPLLNYLLGFLCFWFIFCTGYPVQTTKVAGVLDGMGAQAAGIQMGDQVLSVDGRDVSTWKEMQKIVQGKTGSDTAQLSVRRGDEIIPFTVSIRKHDMDDQMGGTKQVGMLGITASYEGIILKKYAAGEAFISAAQETWGLTILTYTGLWRMVTGRMSMRESITGPLGIFMITSETARAGFGALLNLIALLNISLALFNLLPLPMLDGGHIFFLGVEKLRGRTLSSKTEGVITQVGMTFIVALAVFVTYNDIMRIFGEKISKVFH